MPDTHLPFPPLASVGAWVGAYVADDTAGRDLTMRQMAILLRVYQHDGPHEVRSLAAHFRVSKPVITRALDVLAEMDLIARQVWDADRRVIRVQRTIAGAAYVRRLAALAEG